MHGTANLARRLVGVGVAFLLVMVALVATASTPAQAATGYRLTLSGAGTTTTDLARKLTVTLTRKSAKVTAKASLEYRKGSKWVKEKTFTIRKGKATVKVKHSVGNRTYRVKVSGKATSKSIVVRFVPASFAVKGSGSGHGVGMPQYGAYQLARQGSSAEEILNRFYPGALLRQVNNAGARPGTLSQESGYVKVQVFGPPTEKLASTTVTVPPGGATYQIGTGAAVKLDAGKYTLAVTGALVQLRRSTKDVVASASRLSLRSASGALAVAGAQGTYRDGDLQASVIGGSLNISHRVILNTEYLYGLDEMPSSWGDSPTRGRAALVAQVIAARTFALRAVTSGSGSLKPPAGACDCHLFDDQRSQNYTGWKKAGRSDSASWIAAVNSTIRVVPVSDSSPFGSVVDILRNPGGGGYAETPYYAATGKGDSFGTASNADVFGTPALPHLRAVSDPFSAAAPGYSGLAWPTKKLSQARIAQIFGMSGVVTVSVTARYRGGLAKTLKATTATGRSRSITYAAEKWRTTLGLPAGWIHSVSGS